MRLLVFGAGELGGRVARQWATGGGRALAFTRTPVRHDALRSADVIPHVGGPQTHIRSDDVLVLALPGSDAQFQAITNLRDTLVPARVVLIGSTAVYGEFGVGTRLNPLDGSSPRADAARRTEQAVIDWAGEAAVILRVGGLWCMNRGPTSALARRRTVPPGDLNRILPLIHYDDCATAVINACTHAAPSEAYLVVTPPCPTRRAFYAVACKHLGLPGPTPDPSRPEEMEVELANLRRDLLDVPSHADWRRAACAVDR